ncbi:MAG: hypothetical protein Q8O67_21600 [Deltaproteobacteria bacterium]|nr:hypothetical protein [Deltaproteobacteria bacterium]
MSTRLTTVASLALVGVGLAISTAATIALAHGGFFYLGSFKRDCGSADALDLAAGTWRLFSVFALGAGICATVAGVMAIAVPRFTRPFLVVAVLAAAVLAAAARVFVESPGYVVAPSKSIC